MESERFAVRIYYRGSKETYPVSIEFEGKTYSFEFEKKSLSFRDPYSYSLRQISCKFLRKQISFKNKDSAIKFAKILNEKFPELRTEVFRIITKEEKIAKFEEKKEIT